MRLQSAIFDMDGTLLDSMPMWQGLGPGLLRQFGVVFAALSFMIMRSVRLVASSSQQILLYIAVILQIIGAVALILPVERNLKAYFDDQEDET